MKLRRRTLAKLGLFLLAGALVNVGVAWGIAWWRPTEPDWLLRPKLVELAPPAVWPVDVPPHWEAPESHLRKVSLLLDHDWLQRWSGHFNVVWVDVFRVGFPMRTMEWSEAVDMPHLAEKIWRRVDGGWTTDISSPVAPVAPYRVLPLGFVVNTSVFAMATAVCLTAMKAWIRARRRARGLCPRCKYAIADLPTCPECGETIRREAAEA